MLAKTKEALEILANNQLFTKYDIRFVGGTALSHIINHRLSEDLDFAVLPFVPLEIEEMMKGYGAVKLVHDKTMEDYIANDGEDINDSYMKFMLNDVKVEFFTPPFNLLEENVWKSDKFEFYLDTTLKIASLNTIIYMKTMAFWNRKKYRDLFDIHYILSNKLIHPDKFLNDYLKYNITYNIDNLYKKIQSTTQFYERTNDEGINTLVKDPKPYEWYRIEIEKFIYEVLIEKLYS